MGNGTFPCITSEEITKWDILFKPICQDRALFETKPKLGDEAIQASLAEDGTKTTATKEHHAVFKTKMKK